MNFLLLTGLLLILYFLLKTLPKQIQDVPEMVTQEIKKSKMLYDEIYKQWAEIRNLDWLLIKAIAIVESSERAHVVGDEGKSIGLMQVGPVVGKSFGLSTEDLFNPILNVQAGSGYLKQMIDKFGFELGIQAYNLGETKLRKGLRSPTYLSKVLKTYENLKEEA